jgi:hypothetical protein
MAVSSALFFSHRLISSQPFAEQDLRPEIGRHTCLVEKVRELPPVSFSYSGQLVDNRRAPVDFIQFWLRKGTHVVITEHWVCRWPLLWKG